LATLYNDVVQNVIGFSAIRMAFHRLISLALCVSFVACPSVCRPARSNTSDELGVAPATCEHCCNERVPDNRPVPVEDSKPGREPLRPGDDCCAFGNCLCDGALIDNAGVAVEQAQLLGFYAIGAEAGEAQLTLATSLIPILHPPDGDVDSSGRLLRLRLESLLI
jgi:hypothetical protein